MYPFIAVWPIIVDSLKKKISYYFKCSKAIKRSYGNVHLCFSKTKHNRTRTVLQRVQRLYTVTSYTVLIIIRKRFKKTYMYNDEKRPKNFNKIRYSHLVKAR